MNFLGLNFSFSMERLWLGSEESLHDYLETLAKIDAMASTQMFASMQSQVDDEVDPTKIGDYLVAKNGDTATLSIKGSLVNGYAWYHPFLAGLITSYEAIKAATAQLAEDPDVKNVILDIGSGGGMAVGVQSAGKAIQKLGRKKNVVAHTDSLAASAAYWLAASAGKVTASEMAEVGSIGVIAMMPDYTKALENEGVKVHVIKAGKYKGAGSPFKEFTEADLEYLQGRIDKTNNFFLSHVSKRRGLKLSERDQWAEAKVFYAGEAKAVGLVDEVTELSDVLGGLSASNPSKGKNMNISAEKLAMIAAGASPESVLTSEELAAYNESLAQAEADAGTQEAAAQAEAEVAAQAKADAEAAASKSDHELAKELGRTEAKLETALARIAEMATQIEVAEASVAALKIVAQAAVTNLQVALRQPKETKDAPADIVAQFTALKKLMTDRMPVGRQSNAANDTREPNLKPKVSNVPNPVRPQ